MNTLKKVAKWLYNIAFLTACMPLILLFLVLFTIAKITGKLYIIEEMLEDF